MKDNYALHIILQTLSIIKNAQAKKRLIFNQAPIGGIASHWVIVFFISLPILLYIGIFNDTVFPMLGIAQAIIFYIVFLSMVMILIIVLVFVNNNKVTRVIKPSWNQYFPDIDLKLILASGATPYKDFWKHYSEAMSKGLENEALYLALQKAFVQMQDENSDLIEAMNAARNRA